MSSLAGFSSIANGLVCSSELFGSTHNPQSCISCIASALKAAERRIAALERGEVLKSLTTFDISDGSANASFVELNGGDNYLQHFHVPENACRNGTATSDLAILEQQFINFDDSVTLDVNVDTTSTSDEPSNTLAGNSGQALGSGLHGQQQRGSFDLNLILGLPGEFDTYPSGQSATDGEGVMPFENLQGVDREHGSMLLGDVEAAVDLSQEEVRTSNMPAIEDSSAPEMSTDTASNINVLRARPRCGRCNQTFSRPADLRRHSLSHQETAPRYSCPHLGCPRVGRRGFLRRDKFVEHRAHAHRA